MSERAALADSIRQFANEMVETIDGHEVWSIVVQRMEGEWKVVQVHESYPPLPDP